MATKTVHPRPAEGVPLSAQAGDSCGLNAAKRTEELEGALHDADGLVQDAHTFVDAAIASIRLILLQPDSGGNRETIYTLCEAVGDHMFSAMNNINSMAEKFGVNWREDQRGEVVGLMYKAARPPATNGAEVAS